VPSLPAAPLLREVAQRAFVKPSSRQNFRDAAIASGESR
jgi:hypothetical protein